MANSVQTSAVNMFPVQYSLPNFLFSLARNIVLLFSSDSKKDSVIKEIDKQSLLTVLVMNAIKINGSA